MIVLGNYKKPRWLGFYLLHIVKRALVPCADWPEKNSILGVATVLENLKICIGGYLHGRSKSWPIPHSRSPLFILWHL